MLAKEWDMSRILTQRLPRCQRRRMQYWIPGVRVSISFIGIQTIFDFNDDDACQQSEHWRLLLWALPALDCAELEKTYWEGCWCRFSPSSLLGLEGAKHKKILTNCLRRYYPDRMPAPSECSSFFDSIVQIKSFCVGILPVRHKGNNCMSCNGCRLSFKILFLW